MKRLTIILFVLIPTWLSAAVTSSSRWQVWTTGNDLNSGCFDSNVASPGTNYARQTSAQTTFNGSSVTATTSGASATITLSGYTVASTDNGNCMQIASGTNFTAGFYTITSVDTGANTWTFNANVSTGNGSALVGRMGGAVATLTKPAKVAGNKIWMKATGTYSVSSAQSIGSASGTSLAWIEHEGYTTTEGDGGQITVQRSSGASFTMVSGTGTFNIYRNIIIDCNSGTSMTGLGHTGGTAVFEKIKIQNCTTRGVLMQTNHRVKLTDVYVTGQSGTASFEIQGVSSMLNGCQAVGGSTVGFLFSVTATTIQPVVSRCIAAGNTGSTSHGFKVTSSSVPRFLNIVAYNNGGDGILFDTSTTATAIDAATVSSGIFEGNGGYGLNANAANVPYFDGDYNAYYNNTSGARNNLPAGAHDVTLTGSPFVNAAGGNFGLNNTSGAGAACRAVGWPGTLQYGGTGFLDIGAIQHQDSGTASQKGYSWVANLRNRANPELWAVLHPGFETNLQWPFPVWQTIGTLTIAACAIALRRRR